MKRLITIFIFCCATAICIFAQEGLNINSLYARQFARRSNVTEIKVSGSKAKKHGFTTYHSLSVNATEADRATMVRTVKLDAAKAVNKTEEYRKGKLYYACYTMPTSFDEDLHRINRCVIFLDKSLAKSNPQNTIILIYIDGNLPAEEMLKKIKK